VLIVITCILLNAQKEIFTFNPGEIKGTVLNENFEWGSIPGLAMHCKDKMPKIETLMKVEIGSEAGQFPEKEYINGIAVAVWYNKIQISILG
jgi:hypothetical protein